MPVNTNLVHQAAVAIEDAFDLYQAEFAAITRRAQQRFEGREWHAAQADAVERLDLYSRVVGMIVAEQRRMLGGHDRDTGLWSQMNAEYAALVHGRRDLELAETFFNSITRRIFTTVGVDPQIEFVDSDFELPADTSEPPIYKIYRLPGPSGITAVASLVQEMLHSLPFHARFADLAGDARLAAQEIHASLEKAWGTAAFDRAEIIQSVFYRSNSAYVIGRIWSPDASRRGAHRVLPLVLCLVHPADGIHVDAVLMDEDEASILFSFTRSYFHVQVDQPGELVRFLKSIIPLKRIAELYIAIGYNKHGKTELYRELVHHLASTNDPFVIARGARGMVMSVFSLASYDIVFKVIKDKVEPPKTTTRREVMARYDLVFKHDRAGRLVDAQEFEHLSFDRNRFSPSLLANLLETAPSMVAVDPECVNIRHLYTERRLTPLNLYVQEAPLEAAGLAVIDYGQAIKDMAATNIFPGDVLLKNFGVTRHGRVVFYDYDELCQVTDCNFRKAPAASAYDDEFHAEPWFYVHPGDIFPEEFRTFLGLQEPLRSLFLQAHGDLFEVDFWREMQRRHRSGEVIDILPYPEARRLRPAS